jgi:cobalamin biosynthesis protein CobW
VRLKGRLRQGGKRLPLQIQGVGRRLECWYEERAPSPAAGEPGEREADELELVLLATAGAAGPLRLALDLL